MMVRVPDSDVTVPKPTVGERQLQVALDNMPGALVYGGRRAEHCLLNDRVKEMYIVPQELLQAGRPYTTFLRYLAENGHYGEGDLCGLRSARIQWRAAWRIVRGPGARPGRRVF